MAGRHFPPSGVPVRACARKMKHAMILCVHVLTRVAYIQSICLALLRTVEKPSHTNGSQQHCATLFNCLLDISC